MNHSIHFSRSQEVLPLKSRLTASPSPSQAPIPKEARTLILIHFQSSLQKVYYNIPGSMITVVTEKPRTIQVGLARLDDGLENSRGAELKLLTSSQHDGQYSLFIRAIGYGIEYMRPYP